MPADDPRPEDIAATYCATLVDQWIAEGLRHAVISPGSRSTPMALALAARPELAIHVQLDERSAGFMALGIGSATGAPAVVLTTSGTAAVELHPAVVEADHQCVPMLAVTANRPPELQGVGAPQTIDQRDLYGRAVRWFCEPGPPAAEGGAWWRQLAADALGRTVGEPPGPVQLDLAFREPLLGRSGELPPPMDRPDRPAMRFGLLDEQAARLRQLVAGRRVLVVAGARTVHDADEADAVLGLAEAAGWPVCCDHLSGLRRDHPNVVGSFDALLRTPLAEELRPEVVVRLGGLLASRVLNDWLAASGSAQVGVDRWGRCPHPGFGWHEELRLEPGALAEGLAGVIAGAEAPATWTERWQEVEAAARTAIAAAIEGEPAVLDAELAAVPAGGALVVASSMPVRDLEWYGRPRADVTVLANRGANGIDGVVSTAVGVALAGRPTTCVVGDLAFLHDSNALLALRDRDVALRIVVIDNRGGGIFSFLPQAAALSGERFEQLFGTPQPVDLAVLVAAHGLEVGRDVVIVESDRDANRDLHRRLNDAVAAAVRNLG